MFLIEDVNEILLKRNKEWFGISKSRVRVEMVYPTGGYAKTLC